MDLDGSGVMGAPELLALGQARRKLGHKSGEWTEAQNIAMMAKMGADKHGTITMGNFVEYFDEILPYNKDEFDKTIQQFISCARSISQKKRASHHRLQLIDPRGAASEKAPITLILTPTA